MKIISLSIVAVKGGERGGQPSHHLTVSHRFLSVFTARAATATHVT